MSEDMLSLHRRHLIACGVPVGRALATDCVPTTRNDLRQHYQAIIDGTTPRPKWATPTHQEPPHAGE